MTIEVYTTKGDFTIVCDEYLHTKNCVTVATPSGIRGLTSLILRTDTIVVAEFVVNENFVGFQITNRLKSPNK